MRESGIVKALEGADGIYGLCASLAWYFLTEFILRPRGMWNFANANNDADKELSTTDFASFHLGYSSIPSHPGSNPGH